METFDILNSQLDARLVNSRCLIYQWFISLESQPLTYQNEQKPCTT